MFILNKVAPSNKAVVILNASEKDKLVNNLTVMTNVAQHMLQESVNLSFMQWSI
jgi:hypothetical protein